MTFFEVEIISPDRVVWKGKASYVGFRTVDGSMGVLNRRAPIIAALEISSLIVETEKGKEEFAIHGGILKMDGQVLTVVTDAGENAKEIDIYRAEAAKKRALDRLSGAINNLDKMKANVSLQKSILRVDIAKKKN